MKQFTAKILFFITGPIPTSEDYDAADKFVGAQVSFRNAAAVGPEDRTEACDGVAGAVPYAYKALPSAEEAIAAKKKERRDALKLSNDRLAPNVAAEGAGNPTGAPPASVGNEGAVWPPLGNADGFPAGGTPAPAPSAPAPAPAPAPTPAAPKAPKNTAAAGDTASRPAWGDTAPKS